MKFLIRKRRTAPAVIIVALIDVLIVLVIFLLVTTTFKHLPSVQLTLPESTQKPKSGVSDNPARVITVASNGVIFLDVNPCTIEQLQAQLTAVAATNSNLRVAVRADKNAPWGRVVSIMDVVYAAHVKVMSAYTKEPGKP